jgi:hypothetical protein
MNVLLWILQVALALFCLAGGAYKLFQFDELAKVPATAALPRAGWGAIGVLEMLCAVLLIVPMAVNWMPILTPLAAAVLAVEALALSVNNARYSLQLAATNPLVWTLAMAVMAAFVAWGRYIPQG